MSVGGVLNLYYKDLNDEDFRGILTKLSHRREWRPRKCKRQRWCEGVWELNFYGNQRIGDVGMKHLHMITDNITSLNLGQCNLTPIGIKRLCEFLKTNKSITRMLMNGNQIGAEGVKDVAVMMKMNKTVSLLSMQSCKIHASDCFHLSEGLALNTGLREFAIGNDNMTDEFLRNLCPGLAVNKGLEELNIAWNDEITETGVCCLEKVLRRNTYLKSVIFGPCFKIPNKIPTGPGTMWNKMEYWLALNKCNRKLLQHPNSTPTQWRDAIILSSEAGNPDAMFMFLTSKPELVVG